MNDLYYFDWGDATSSKSCKTSLTVVNYDTILHDLKAISLWLLFDFAFCFIISLCPNHVETNLTAVSFDNLAVVSMVATKWYIYVWIHMMTSSNGNIFRVTGPLWGEFTGHRWIPLTMASDAELWCFLWSAAE